MLVQSETFRLTLYFQIIENLIGFTHFSPVGCVSPIVDTTKSQRALAPTTSPETNASYV